jgi:Flp pilus assembly protein TadG
VELAAVLPVLILLLLGAVDFGRFATTYLVVEGAARSAAATGAAQPYTAATKTAWADRVRQAAVEQVTGLPGHDASQLQVTTTTAAEGADDVRVQVTVRYPFTAILPWPGVPAEVALSQTAAVRLLR